ncbi:hypothetical protein [Allomesorhizobium camelthorni]|uniref:Uncharacterized protein n=1 Tax=Allomesorhizobium camelthorni TaxID=475069 RepID=A0A6G4WGB4_9HYPH|nr:hypothetical protein [Mesorhizobium camelthorni]NGO53832.1 hypothetical protein [Mesorhizobium camelthorni]
MTQWRTIEMILIGSRESFTFRRMRSWQIWSLLIVIALLAIGLLFWA